MINRKIDCPIDTMVGPAPKTYEIECPIQYIQWVQTALINAFQFTLEQLGEAASRQKRDYDRNLKPREYQKNDWVWRFYPPTAGSKLDMG